MIKDSGERQSFETGCVRDTAEGKPQMHFLAPFMWREFGPEGMIVEYFLNTGNTMELRRALNSMIQVFGIERLCNHLEAGAEKYAAYNWAKGMPTSRCLDSLGRHLYSLSKGDEDEDHAAAAMCNLMFMIHYLETRPELNDLPVYMNLYPKGEQV